jgi:hypothetical protein
MTLALTSPGFAPALEELRWMLRNSRTPKRRTMRRFAEEEIRIPDGRYKGSKFRVKVQPFAGVWLDAVDSGMWNHINTTGPTQTGKTLLACGIPVCFHLFEIGESVGFGVPDMDMADDKWRVDIQPVIAASNYARYLPTRGEGSRGGKVKNAITFANGAELKFFTGGASGEASDKGRAGYTTRVMVITEKSAFGKAGESSDEASKLEQLRVRTMHYGSLARIYEESTVTTSENIVWTDYKNGTESRLASPCGHCGEYVSPEREHLVGWQDAANVVQARQLAHFICPACGTPIDEAMRHWMNAHAVLVHKGQTVRSQRSEVGGPISDFRPLISGDAPQTDMLGFRWSAFANNFRTAGDVGADEWKARHHATSEDDAEKKLCQFVWCLPYEQEIERVAPLTREGIMHRQAKTPRGIVPEHAEIFTVGIDMGQSFRTCWFAAPAWQLTGDSTIVDYGPIDVLAEELGVERAIVQALRDFHDKCEAGWGWQGHPHTRQPDFVLIDVGWKDTLVYQLIREWNAKAATFHRYWPCKGFGAGQFAGQKYNKPKKTGGQVVFIGDHYHGVRLPAHGVILIEFDADYWKVFTQTRLGCPVQQADGTPAPGVMRLFQDMPRNHARFARMITSERQRIEFEPDVGEVVKWTKSGANHLLDATGNACIGGHFGGVRIEGTAAAGSGVGVQGSGEAESQPRLVTPDGRPFSVLER